jgi:hypothetical protein
MANEGAVNPHFATAATWRDAESLVTFRPAAPRWTAGLDLKSLRIFVMDHKHRDVPVGDRSVEAHYGDFVFSQTRRDVAEAKRMALDVSYGLAPKVADVGGHEARVYDLGPVPQPDDIDPRSPAVVTWHDGEMFYLIASDKLDLETLLRIARSFYDDGSHGKAGRKQRR